MMATATALKDHLGSTSLTLDNSGTRIAELRYDVWGKTIYADSATPTNRRYTGQLQDFKMSNMTLYFYNARYYDPVLARFTQADTIVPQPGDPQSLNRFSYVLNNPLRYTAPTGHYECSSDERDTADSNYCYGVEISPGFSEEEILLIIAALHDYAAFLGGEQAFFDNVTVNLKRIRKSRHEFDNAYYDYENKEIRMGANLLHGITNRGSRPLLVPVYTMSDEYHGHLGANLAQPEYFKFVLAHELTHVVTQPNPRRTILYDFESDFYDTVYQEVFGIKLWPIEMKPNVDDALGVQNAGRDPGEHLADVIAAYIYGAVGLSNGNYDTWIEESLPWLLQ